MQSVKPVKIVDLFPKDLINCREIGFDLFTNCNLSCKFCCQQLQHTTYPNQINFDNMLRKADKVMSISKHRDFLIEMMGGELFTLKTTKDEYRLYVDFLDKLHELLTKHNKVATISMTTNLVYANIDEVKKIVDRYDDVQLFVSFDFCDRFNSEKVANRFLDQLKRLDEKQIPYRVSIVVTKQAIDALKNKGENYHIFDYLYKTHPDKIVWEYYDKVGDPKIDDHYRPTNYQYYQFLIYCLENYVLLQDCQFLIHQGKYREPIQPICRREYMIRPVMVNNGCSDVPIKDKVEHFVKLHKCDRCKHISYCGMMCYKRFIDSEFCVQSAALDYVIENLQRLEKATIDQQQAVQKQI